MTDAHALSRVYHDQMPLFGSVGYGAQVFDPQLSVFLKPHLIEIGKGARIDAFVKIEGGQGVFIGSGVHVSSFAHLNIGGGELRVHNYAALTSGVRVVTGSNTAAGRSMSSASPKKMQVVERGRVVIGEFAFVGAGATILQGAHIGQYAIVGAGAVVTKPVEPYAVVMGIPAQVVGTRELQADGTFVTRYFAKNTPGGMVESIDQRVTELFKDTVGEL